MDLQSIIAAAAQARGIDPAHLLRMAQIESGMNPSAISPTGAEGLFQFTEPTARQYGLVNEMDPAASSDAAARLWLDNQRALAADIGRQPTPGEVYLAHQQGAGGAGALLSRPNENAIDVLQRVTGDRATAERNLMVNGGDPSMTAQQFSDKWINKFANPAGQPLSATPEGVNPMGYPAGQPYPTPAPITPTNAAVGREMAGQFDVGPSAKPSPLSALAGLKAPPPPPQPQFPGTPGVPGPVAIRPSATLAELIAAASRMAEGQALQLGAMPGLMGGR